MTRSISLSNVEKHEQASTCWTPIETQNSLFEDICISNIC